MVADYEGEGPGAITKDGCAVELYRRLPYNAELDRFDEYLPEGCSVLELGCGAGRLTRPLLDRGHRVTAVDNSPEMLAHVPPAARRVCSDIERLRLDQRFDVVMLASNLINVVDEHAREALLSACRRHLAADGAFVFQHFDAQWFRNAKPGLVKKTGDVDIRIEALRRDGDVIEVALRYDSPDAQWKHRFRARLFSEEQLQELLAATGFAPASWIDATWGAARLQLQRPVTAA